MQATETELTFTVVFVVMLVGALLLTSNVVLLGGSVSLLQAVSLLGYCMFPLDLAAVGCSFVRFFLSLWLLCGSWDRSRHCSPCAWNRNRNGAIQKQSSCTETG